MSGIDPVKLTAELVSCPSITPQDAGAQDVVAQALQQAGFDIAWANRGGIRNLFARWGAKGHARSFGFNGHTDVVPLGDETAWSMPPFGAQIKDGLLYGRGSTDMKSGVAAFVAAAIDFITNTPPDGAILITLTGDEEGPALDGTTALLEYMDQNNEAMSVCLVGEPTCPNEMGEMMKIGRRGSLNAFFTVTGRQGHAAYPHRANNPLPAMMRLMDRLAAHELDQGSDHFEASTLAIVTVDTGNPATNVIPADCKATVNIRFNDRHSGASLSAWLQEQAGQVAQEFNLKIDLEVKISGESFVTPPGAFSQLISAAVQAETNRIPKASTSGGTSDARFIKDHCPVVEFGLVGQSMHQVDEHVALAHIHQLKSIYSRILTNYFA